MRQGKRHIAYDSTNQLVSAANTQTYALSVTYGDWGKIQQYDLSQTDLASNTTTSQTRYYSYGSLNEGQTTFAPNNISYADGTNVNEQYGINGSLQRRETTHPDAQPNEELYRFGADGNLRLYSYDRLFYSLYGYDGGTTRTYKYSMDLSPNWVNGRLESVNFNMHNAMFYPNSYLNFNANGYYTKHYYNGMERIASRLGDQNLSINVNDPDLQDRKDQLDSNIRRNITEITGYEFLPVGEEQNHEDPKPIYDLPVIGLNNLQPSADGIYYYHSNHLGSTCYVTDENAIVQQGFLYAPFGEITNEYNNSFGNGVIPKYSFNAKELDEETGMYYYEARYYAPPTFTSRDPLFEKYPTFSPYAYCANNPVKYIDPTGRDAINAIGKPPYEKWSRLNSREKNILMWDIHFYKAISIEENANKAFTTTKSIFGFQGKGDKSDAFRHAYWMALNVQSVGKRFSQKWGDAHEYSTPIEEIGTDLYMDIHNNDIGIEIGLDNPNATPEELQKIILDRIDQGDMLIINENNELIKSDGSLIKDGEIRREAKANQIGKEIINENQ